MRARFYILLGCLVSSLFNACSDVAFTSDGRFQKENSSLPAAIEDLVSFCDELALQGKVKTLHQNIYFADSKADSARNQVCEFGQNGNLTEQDGRIRAQYTQSKALNLPANAILCDLELNSPAQSIKYDDIFFLNFNGYVIASNHWGAVSKLNAEVVSVKNQSLGIYTYDWNKVVDTSFNNNGGNDFCLGGLNGLGQCAWPLTENTGSFDLDYDPELLINIGARAPASQQELSLVVTGDNDNDVDCYHSGLEFNVTVKYY